MPICPHQSVNAIKGDNNINKEKPAMNTGIAEARSSFTKLAME
ncbi:hypothetical protein [Ureibacillus thermophilus]|nr:hypothetical protein [Ureibacillus thermophilus]